MKTFTKTKTSDAKKVRRWPLILLALPAGVATWSGWVGLGEKAGFGEVEPLPGIAEWTINSAITLPIGVEAYAAIAMNAWLSSSDRVSPGARRFAKWSAIGSLLLGMLGQVAYHLLEVFKLTVAPWPVVVAVACLPVVVLGLGAALGHMLAHPGEASPVRSDEGSLEASLDRVSDPSLEGVSEVREASPVTLTGEASPALTEAPVTLTETPPVNPSLASPVTLTGSLTETSPVNPQNPVSEPSPAPASEPVSEPVVTSPVKEKEKAAKAPAKRSARTAIATVATLPKMDISKIPDADLVRRLTEDFPDGELSANKIRLRYSIGTDKAKLIYSRWENLTEGLTEIAQ